MISFCRFGWHRPLLEHREFFTDGIGRKKVYHASCSCRRSWMVTSRWPYFGFKIPCQDAVMTQIELDAFMRIDFRLVSRVRKWLGPAGVEHFRDIKKKHGKINAVWMDGIIPHPVHFREGMQVRNFMRGTGLCDGWTAHDYDNFWIPVVERAIQ